MLRSGCFCFCKGNQFYANHNIYCKVTKKIPVVFAFAKVINFMLITTQVGLLIIVFVLFLLLQR